MSLVRHHFLKEFRYLRLRWFAFLALLLFEMAVNLEWLFPFQPGVQQPAWLSYLPMVLLVAGLSLLISCPEDHPGSDRSFISTRPLPLRDYWFARCGLWLCLIVLPVVVQSGAVLAFSGCPWQDVLQGMWERGVMATGFSAWLLPASALWRRREAWWVMACLVISVLVFSKFVDAIALSVQHMSLSWTQTWAGIAAGWMVFAISTAVLAWWHLRSALPLRRRVLISVVLGCLSLLAARYCPWGSPADVPHDQALVLKMQPDLKASLDFHPTEFQGFEKDYGRHIWAWGKLETGHPTIHARLRHLHSQVSQDGRGFRCENPPSQRASLGYSFGGHDGELFRTDRVLRNLFPAGTLFLDGGKNHQWGLQQRQNTKVVVLAAPFPDPGKPMQVTTDYAVDWYQRDIALDLPLHPGSHGRCDSHAWEITRIFRPTDSEPGPEGSTPGSLTVNLSAAMREHWDLHHASTILLYSPQRQMTWLTPVKQTFHGRRGDSGWVRVNIELQWNGIFSYADGADAGVDVSQLRLILLRSRYLGSSPWTWKSRDFCLKDHPAHDFNLSMSSAEQLYAGREAKAFQERLATFTVAGAGSTESVARRYLYDLVSTLHATHAAYKAPAHAEITKAFQPLGQHHLPLLLEMPSNLWPGWANRTPRTVLDASLTEAHREEVIDRMLGSPTLISVVLRKGWAEQAKRLRPQIFSRRRLPYGVDQLLLEWGDEESHEKLLDSLRHDPDSDTMKALDKMPALRPRLEALALEGFHKHIPVLRAHNYWEMQAVGIASDYGSREALDVCLRSRAMGGDLPRDAGVPFPTLLNSDGLPLWKSEEKSVPQWPRYRALKVSDFDYLPKERAWKLRQP